MQQFPNQILALTADIVGSFIPVAQHRSPVTAKAPLMKTRQKTKSKITSRRISTSDWLFSFLKPSTASGKFFPFCVPLRIGGWNEAEHLNPPDGPGKGNHDLTDSSAVISTIRAFYSS
ncbi:hypothetical protein JI735_04000 [Paenibacillus sonchi]|uniref:Uncharacterized protein n=1 Tax=Paenibacillus sonchi TaxID=373687 RepID=A0A974PEE5_9BACL|nr:hypothetical protein [Paenibacillus sonchi]QQZ61893.1 hypothetical protein JI735_04000 [Paenibacillus sonchi]